MGMTLSAPEPLAAHHDMSTFDSGEPQLDQWLTRRALVNQLEGASRTYVVTASGDRVVGYYALANGALVAAEAPGRVRRNMPDPIPVMVLGRLAVDRTWQGRGLGKGLLRDALLRTLQAAEIAGIRAVLVHALHNRAAEFYRQAGFQPSPISDTTLILLLKDIRSTLQNNPTERQP